MNNKLFLILIMILSITSQLFGADTEFYNKEHPKPPKKSKYTYIQPIQGHNGNADSSSFLPPDGDKLYDYYLTQYTKPNNLKMLKNIWKRASYFTEFIDLKIQENQMPAEILYLPLIESVYDPNAVSKSGATGLWQFMTNSIDGYDMAITEWLDERKDFWKSTEGAIAKLKYNYSQLNDWLLAIAAYNCGLGKMKRTVKEANTNNFWELCSMGYIGNETMNYIPKLLAISHIMVNRDKYGITDTINTNIHWERIPLKTCVDIRLLAKECDIPQDILLMGNAELNYSITPPVKSMKYLLKVPHKYVASVNNALKKNSGLTDFHIYIIQKGDTLSQLAKYYGISVSMIKSFNNVNPDNLRIGTKLIIPVTKDDIKPYNPVREIEPKWQPTERRERFSEDYLVKSGDTLWSIAKKFGTDVNHLAYFNNLSPDAVLKLNTKLKVPAK